VTAEETGEGAGENRWSRRWRDGWARWRIWLYPLVTVLLFSLALGVLHRELASLHWVDVSAALARLGPTVLLLSLSATALSYGALTGYDVLALRHLSHPLPYRQVGLASFVATVVGHNVGMALVSASAVRTRFYTAWGLSATEVAGVVAFLSVTLGLGLAFVTSLALLLEPTVASRMLFLPTALVQGMGALLLVAVLAYLGLCATRRAPFRFRHWRVSVPNAATATQQLALAVVDLALGATALYVLLPAHPSLNWPVFVGVYVLAVMAGVISHVPAGLGVFETVMLLALPELPKDSLLAAILVYRVVYYLVPLGLVALLVSGLAIRERQHAVVRSAARLRRVFVWAAPTVVSAVVFLVGAVLLFSGSLPAASSRLHVLRGLLPLPVLEVSHLIGSLLGLMLLILAHGLYRRIDVAYRLVLWLLAGAVLVSLLKGLDIEEALVSLSAMGVLWLGRGAFRRRGSAWPDVLSPRWVAAIVVVLLATVWLGLFSYRHVDYAQDLWWHFAFRGDAPRFLRATLTVVVALIALAALRWLRPKAPAPGAADAPSLQTAAALVAASPRAEAALALLGDKRLLFSPAQDAFLMYQVQGQSWIAMGDPVGPTAACEALAWQFRELVDRHGGRVVFYQVDRANLGLYLDLGLSAIKLGEEAIVSLPGFSLEGAARAALRQVHRRAQRDGLVFEVVSLQDHPELMAELRQVSDTWLADKHTREKGFSLGRFDPAYLAHFPIAVAWHGGQVVAFANLWCSAGQQELSVDLMRYRPSPIKSIMDCFFVELMLWGQRQGYAQFNLGMAPLSGLETHPLAPLWHRMGTLLFRHGEHFYNFQGLRSYKAKFDPQWRARYLAAPGGVSMPAVLLDVAALIAGGYRGIVRR
jgi:phosphatidylglycerol lysyltransferase